MSTEGPVSKAPELTAIGDATTTASSSTNWQNINDNSAKPKRADELKKSLKKSSSDDKASGGGTATSATSSTAYSFTGSALGSDSTANLNLAKATTSGSGSGSSSTTTTTTTTTSNNDDDKNDDSIYECNICLDTAKDAVVSMCGHLFCWPCLHTWLETRPNRKLCPVCKAAIGKDKVIPLYGRNSTKQEDPRNKVPPRPAGQRTEPEPQQGFTAFGFGDGFHMSFGIGAFPFGFFASSFNFGEPRPAAANRGTTQYEDEQQLSKLFLYLAFLCIAWLLFA